VIWSRPELRVLFVCTANICRSPLAEGMLRHRLCAMGLGGRVDVRSAASCGGQNGRRPDPRVEKLAAQAGVSLSGIRTRTLTAKMIQRSDYVLVMERRHLDDVARLYAVNDVADNVFADEDFPDKTFPDNVQLLGNFLPSGGGAVQDIPDPYFGNWQNFCDLYELIDSALMGFSACIQTRLGIFPDL